MRPLFKAAIDTNALVDALSSFMTLRRRGNVRYPYVAKALEKGHLRLFLLTSVREEFERVHSPRSNLRQLLDELVETGKVAPLLIRTSCCLTEQLRNCYEENVKPLIANAHEQDEVILNEFFGLVDISLFPNSSLPLADRVLVFITNNRRHFNTNVASAATTCIASMLRQLNRDGIFPPMGIYDIAWLDDTLRKLMRRFSMQ